MALLNFQDVSISFGGPPLLEKVNMQVEKGERVCIVGRNGEGKTTLLRLISRNIEPDSGLISIQNGTTSEILSQDIPQLHKGTVRDVVAGGLEGISALLKEYYLLTDKLPQQADKAVIKRMNTLQERLENEQGWRIHQKIETVLTRLSLDPDVLFETLSVGYRRKVLLARALVSEPDILLLDEPTNHLDINTIGWIEGFLQRFRGTIVFVTHDRMFLQNLATRIIEVDRGRLVNWACDYRTFLDRREAVLEVEETQRLQFKRTMTKEEEWLRKGIKARRTRNEGRVRALMKLREEQRAWRMRLEDVSIKIQGAKQSGKLVIEGENICHGYGGPLLINNFSIKILRGDRIGIIGPNGTGKSTLISILLGHIKPEKGKIRSGANLEVVYFDQLREQLDEELTVRENIAEGKDTILINGKQRHVIGYLKDFLFSSDRARSPVKILSGGEKNRLLLAKLFTRPSNVLVLDEPTNDLDMETLELLEERLLDYEGTIILVSHDREFLNNVVTSSLVFEGNGQITEYAGGYDDWLDQRPEPNGEKVPVREPRISKKVSRKEQKEKNRPRKLTFTEKKELEALPVKIEELEKEQKTLYEQMADPGFYKEGGYRISLARARMDDLALDLEDAYRRWEELASIKEGDPMDRA